MKDQRFTFIALCILLATCSFIAVWNAARISAAEHTSREALRRANEALANVEEALAKARAREALRAVEEEKEESEQDH